MKRHLKVTGVKRIRKYFKKADLIIIAAILLISFVGALIVFFKPIENELYVCIYIDKELVERRPLTYEYDEVNISTVYGYNKLVISEEMAFIYESDCRHTQCMSVGIINRPGGVIVCAPHHLVITIEDGVAADE